MSTDPSFADYILEQLQNAGDLAIRKMFGEYALYCEGKVVALLCDNQLFVKPTATGRAFIGEKSLQEAPAYPGAKPSFLIENLDDSEWLTTLIQLTERELPIPKPKNKTSPKKKTKKGLH